MHKLFKVPSYTPSKPWAASKTLWFNALIAALGALEVSAHFIQPFVDGSVYGYGMVVLIVGNAVLRTVTHERLGK